MIETQALDTPVAFDNGPAKSQHLLEAEPLGKLREQLVASMRGSKVAIPDFQQMLNHWLVAVHPDAVRLSEKAWHWLESTLSSPEDEKRLRWLKACNIDSLAASWWPYARFEALLVVTYMSIWLFAWDDETDSQEFSSLVDNFEKASSFRAETIRYLEAALSSSADDLDVAGVSAHRLITNFRPIGEAFRESCDDRQVEVFLRELRFFVEMTEEEHKLQTTRSLPTIEQYNRRRMGSSATRVCLALQEYALGIQLPREVMESDAMRTIWHESNVIISTCDQGQVDTLIPLLSLKLGSVQAAVNEAADMVRSSIRRFEAAERDLLESQSSAPGTQENVRKFIEGCKYACTANMNWSLSTGRYKLNIDSTRGGIYITL
ncbi:terpenoid synthase [Biscogniauxia marginata]|nr:terpenoid synthase [Biscogniauxia marginata]